MRPECQLVYVQHDEERNARGRLVVDAHRDFVLIMKDGNVCRNII